MNTTSNIAPAQQYFYDTNLLVRAVSNFVHTMWAQVRDLPRNSGEGVKFRRYGNLTAATTALSEGVTPAGSDLSVTDITATPLQYGDFLLLTDKLQFETLDPILTEAGEILGDQAGDTLDQLTRDVMVAGSTVQYASTAGARTDITTAMVLNASEIREAVMTLQENKAKPIKAMINPADAYNTVPLGECFVGIIHPRTLKNLKGDSAFTPVHKYPNQSDVMAGEKGAVDEVRFVMTPNAKVFTNGGSGGAVDVYATMILARDFYGITRVVGEAMRNIIKPLGSAGSADPLDQRATTGWKATFIAKRLNESFAVRIEHGVN